MIFWTDLCLYSNCCLFFNDQNRSSWSLSNCGMMCYRMIRLLLRFRDFIFVDCDFLLFKVNLATFCFYRLAIFFWLHYCPVFLYFSCILHLPMSRYCQSYPNCALHKCWENPKSYWFAIENESDKKTHSFSWKRTLFSILSILKCTQE